MPSETNESALAGAPSAVGVPGTAQTNDSRRAMALNIGAWALMLTGSLLNLLNYNEYPIFRSEVGLLWLVLMAVSGVLGLLERGAPRLAFLFTGLLVWIGIDLNTDNMWLPVLVGLAALVAAFFYNEYVTKIVAAAFGSVLLFQLGTAAIGPARAQPQVVPARSAAPANPLLPPVIHLLMDSDLGTEGMASDPAFAKLRAETIAFYTKHGFRLYDDAYSRHANTANSIPYLLSFGAGPLATVSQLDVRLRPHKLAYFQLLTNRGYKVSIGGVNYLDLCTGQAIAECHQFPHSQLDAITKFLMSTRDRAVTIGIDLVSMSSLLTRLYENSVVLAWRLGGPPPVAMRNLEKTASINSVLTLRELQRILANPQPGHAYFVHLLLPHEPYVFDENCVLKPHALWATEQSPPSRLTRDKDYREQTRCMLKLLGQLFDTLDRTEIGRNSIIIVHGDHGSRIVDSRPLIENPSPTPHDFGMTYSATFAIRASGIASGVTEGRASLDELLGDFAKSNFTVAPVAGKRPSEIILATWDWIPKKRVPLPEYEKK